MGKMEKPPKEVLDIIRRRAMGDPEAEKIHRAMSSKGGKEAAKTRIIKALAQELIRDDATLQQSQTESISPDGDVLPPSAG